jgi:plastocyanin
MLTSSIALLLAVILINTSMAAFPTAGAQQQEEQQVESDGGLTAILNGESFRKGDTITVSGTVEERDPDSDVLIRVIDPQSKEVGTGVVDVSPDNTFTYSFVAGEQERFDFNEPMVTSGNYRVIVSYLTSDLDREVVDFIFEYTATSGVTRGATTTDATTGDSTSGAGAINVMAINQSTAQAIMYTEQAYIAMQNNDTRSVFRNLNLALNALESIQSNLTLSARGSSSNNNNTTGTIGATGVSIVPGSSSLTNDAYEPNPVQVSVGDTVTWTNDDSTTHTVTSGQSGQPDGKFDSSPNFNPLMAPGQAFSHTFTEAGQYPYYCALHPNMVGTVSVS